MYIGTPIWRLKRECPCCGMGDLELVSCPNCCKVYARCDEMLVLFLDPLDVSMEKLSASQEGGSLLEDADRKCDSCGVIMKLRYSKDIEITALGLTVKDYE